MVQKERRPSYKQDLPSRDHKIGFEPLIQSSVDQGMKSILGWGTKNETKRQLHETHARKTSSQADKGPYSKLVCGKIQFDTKHNTTKLNTDPRGTKELAIERQSTTYKGEKDAESLDVSIDINSIAVKEVIEKKVKNVGELTRWITHRAKENKVNSTLIKVDINTIEINKVTEEGCRETIKNKGRLVNWRRLVTMISKPVSVNVIWDEQVVFFQRKNDYYNSCCLEIEYRDKIILDRDVEASATTKAELGQYSSNQQQANSLPMVKINSSKELRAEKDQESKGKQKSIHSKSKNMALKATTSTFSEKEVSVEKLYAQ